MGYKVTSNCYNLCSVQTKLVRCNFLQDAASNMLKKVSELTIRVSSDLVVIFYQPPSVAIDSKSPATLSLQAANKFPSHFFESSVKPNQKLHCFSKPSSICFLYPPSTNRNTHTNARRSQHGVVVAALRLQLSSHSDEHCRSPSTSRCTYPTTNASSCHTTASIPNKRATSSVI